MREAGREGGACKGYRGRFSLRNQLHVTGNIVVIKRVGEFVVVHLQFFYFYVSSACRR